MIPASLILAKTIPRENAALNSPKTAGPRCLEIMIIASAANKAEE